MIYRGVGNYLQKGKGMRKTILSALLLACGTAQAANWVSLGKTDDGKQEIFIDGSSIRIAGHTRRVWIKTIYADHTMPGGSENPNRWQHESMDHWAFDCREANVMLEAGIDYFEDGTSFSLPSNRAKLWHAVAPETLFDLEMHFICAWKPK
jgi:hypothetical protein